MNSLPRLFALHVVRYPNITETQGATLTGGKIIYLAFLVLKNTY